MDCVLILVIPFLYLAGEQSRLFRARNVQGGRDLDAAIQMAKLKSQAAVDRLRSHETDHRLTGAASTLASDA